MTRLYRITPLEKKNVEYFVDVFEHMPDGRIRGFDVTEIWRWGYGFREEDDPVWAFEIGSNGVHCNPQIGWGCELDDLISVYVDFGCWDMQGNTYDDGFTEEEKAQIEAILRGEDQDEDGRWGTAWVYDGDHAWEVEDDHVRIVGPVRIDLVDEAGYGDSAIIEENVKPYDDTNETASQ